MASLANAISDYLGFLETQCGMSVSVHFDRNSPYSLPDASHNVLLRYNSHKNPYCMVVKKQLHSMCVRTQEQLYSACGESGFCHTCHAGVLQYIYPLTYKSSTVGFAAVCGFRQATHKPVADHALWSRFLSEAVPPARIYDRALAPLNIMVDRLFALEATESSDEYTALLRYLNEYHVDVRLEDLCRQFGRSRSHISHLFKKKTGVSIREYCSDLCLEDARHLLLMSDRSVTEIAYDTGFCDPSYFIRCFKAKFGLSPHQFRKQQGKQDKDYLL